VIVDQDGADGVFHDRDAGYFYISVCNFSKSVISGLLQANRISTVWVRVKSGSQWLMANY